MIRNFATRKLFGKNDFAVYGDKDQMLQEISKVVDACRANEGYSARVVFSNDSIMRDILRHIIRYGVAAYTDGKIEQLVCIKGGDRWVRFNNESFLEFLSVTDRREFFSSNSNSTLICIGENGEVLESLVYLSYTVFSDFYKITEIDNDSNTDFELLEQYLDELTKGGNK